MTFLRGLLVLLVVIMLSNCSTMKINTDYDPEANFSALKTYDWMSAPRTLKGDPRIIDNTLLESRVRNAVDRELAAKGYERQSSNKPDFYIGYHAALRDKLDARTMNTYYGYRGGWRWAGGGPELRMYEYVEGSLILDIVEPETLRLLWRGSAEAEVKPSDSPEKREKRVNEAVQKILMRFPPQK